MKNLGGRQHTSGLFKELGDKNAPYSLDIFKKLFLEMRDSTGYICSQELLIKVSQKERWSEWNRIFRGNARMQRIYEEWKEELEILVRAEAERLMAGGCDKKDIPRLRYILDGDLYGKRKAGRPTKGEQAKKVRIQEGVKDFNQKNPETLDTVIELAAD